MFAEFEYKGSWYLPDKIDNKVYGILRFQANEYPVLDILGSLHTREEIYSKSLDLQVVVGQTIGGKEITLIKCINSDRQFNSDNDASSFQFSILGFVILGGLFTSLSDLICNNIYVRFNMLEDWLDFRNLEFESNKEDITLLFKKTQPFKFEISKGLEGEFSTAWERSFSRSSESDVKAISKSFFAIRTIDKDKLPVKELIDMVVHFQRFLTLVTGESIHPREVIVDRINEDGLERLNIVYYEEFDESVPIRKSGPLMPLVFSKIEKRFEQIIKKWYNNWMNLKPVQDLFFEVIYKRHRFNENSFLNTIQALETFHRRTKKSYVTDKKEHKEKINRIIESVDDDYKQWLKEKLNYSNEPSLHQRLEEIIKDYRTERFSELVPDIEKFIKEAKWSRNYYTHYDPKNKGKALNGIQLYYLNQRLLILLKICFLSELGFNAEEIDQFIMKDSTYRMLKLSEK